jgi:hypothetical protein
VGREQDIIEVARKLNFTFLQTRDLSTRIYQRKLELSNVLNNIRHLKHAHNLKIKGPALVLAAGPSLDDDIHLVKKFRGTILAVDTTAKILKEHGIKPAAHVCLDPRPENSRHFKNFQTGVPIAFWMGAWCQIHPKNHPMIPAFYEKPLVKSLWQDDAIYIKGMGGTVTIFALALAMVNGCDPIIFGGADFCQTEKSHCSSELARPANARDGEILAQYGAEVNAILKKNTQFNYFKLSDTGKLDIPVLEDIEAVGEGSHELNRLRENKNVDGMLGLLKDRLRNVLEFLENGGDVSQIYHDFFIGQILEFYDELPTMMYIKNQDKDELKKSIINNIKELQGLLC